MKKLLSLLLVFLLLAGLGVPALASGEAAEETPGGETPAESIAPETPDTGELAAEEVDYTTKESPASEAAIDGPALIEAAPAQDGLVSVSGSDHLTQFASGTPLELTGDYTLYVDCDKTLGSIRGGEGRHLSIVFEGDYTLTVVNDSGGHGISVGYLNVSGGGTLYVNAGADGLHIDKNIEVSGTALTIWAAADGIYSRYGSITLTDCGLHITGQEEGLCAPADITLTRCDGSVSGLGHGLYLRDQSSLPARVKIDGGDLAILGSSERTGGGIYIPHGSLTSSADLGVYAYNEAKKSENFAICASEGVILKGGPVEIESAFGGICSNGDVELNCPTTIDVSAGPGIMTGEWVMLQNGATVDIVTYNAAVGDDTYPNYGISCKTLSVYNVGYGTELKVSGYVGVRAVNSAFLQGPCELAGKSRGLYISGFDSSASGLVVGAPVTICSYSNQEYALQINNGRYSVNDSYQILQPANGYFGTLSSMATVFDPTTAEPADLVVFGEKADEIISQAALVGLTLPYDGRNTGADAQPAPGSPFTIREQHWSDSYDVPHTGTFQNGVTYWYTAVLVPKEGYAFPDTYRKETGTLFSDQMDLTVNGAAPSRMTRYYEDAPEEGIPAGALQINVSFTAAGPTYDGDLALINFVPPAAGRPVGSDVRLADFYPVILTDDGWQEITDAGFTPTEDKTFQAGKMYIWTCNLEVPGDTIYERKENDDYAGTIKVNGQSIPRISSLLGLVDAMSAIVNGEEFTGYLYNGNSVIRIILARRTAAPPVVQLDQDGKTAQITGDYTGYYARVSLILDNGGVSGLYVTQAEINAPGKVIIPSFAVPGLTVTGVAIALVPTLEDIQKPNPAAVSVDFVTF